MRTFVVRNFFLAVLTLLPLAGIAHAQGENVNTMADKQDAAERKAAKDYMEKRELDEKYKATLQNLQAPAASNDPWGNVRPAAPPKSAAKPAAGAVKSASGSGKPVVGPATPANPAIQKGQ